MSILPGWIDEILPADLAFSAGYFPHAELSEQKVRRATAYYYATISQIDYHVGRLVDCLKAKGLYDNTLILYTGDHGEFLGFHHLLLKGTWTKPYTKEQAFFPLSALREDKYWPPVGRVDNVAGDRTLVCSCPPMEAYRDAAE